MRLQDLHNQLNNKQLTVTDLVDESYRRIAETEPKVRAFITLDEENARKQAAELDKTLQAGGDRGLLFGLPAGIKDNIVTEGLLTTCASQFLRNYNPIFDATVTKKLKAAQSVTIGKLNMDEFAMGGSNENSGFHPSYNPWNTERVPGGSSGGSAATVAARQVYFALGSDTGGS
ncbi:amidase, partial [Paenibacillus darwinianus]